MMSTTSQRQEARAQYAIRALATRTKTKYTLSHFGILLAHLNANDTMRQRLYANTLIDMNGFVNRV